MRELKLALGVAVVASLMAASSTAWACDVYGNVVCATDTAVGVSGVPITVTSADEVATATSGADGSFHTHVSLNETYVVSPGGESFLCIGNPIYLAPIQVDDALQCPAPPPAPADCSPGYYKNHPEAWCVQCGFAQQCSAMIQALSAKGPGSDAIRSAVKAQIDACFGTAAASPCSDD